MDVQSYRVAVQDVGGSETIDRLMRSVDRFAGTMADTAILKEPQNKKEAEDFYAAFKSTNPDKKIALTDIPPEMRRISGQVFAAAERSDGEDAAIKFITGVNTQESINKLAQSEDYLGALLQQSSDVAKTLPSGISRSSFQKTLESSLPQLQQSIARAQGDLNIAKIHSAANTKIESQIQFAIANQGDAWDSVPKVLADSVTQLYTAGDIEGAKSLVKESWGGFIQDVSNQEELENGLAAFTSNTHRLANGATPWELLSVSEREQMERAGNEALRRNLYEADRQEVTERTIAISRANRDILRGDYQPNQSLRAIDSASTKQAILGALLDGNRRGTQGQLNIALTSGNILRSDAEEIQATMDVLDTSSAHLQPQLAQLTKVIGSAQQQPLDEEALSRRVYSMYAQWAAPKIAEWRRNNPDNQDPVALQSFIEAQFNTEGGGYGAIVSQVQKEAEKRSITAQAAEDKFNEELKKQKAVKSKEAMYSDVYWDWVTETNPSFQQWGAIQSYFSPSARIEELATKRGRVSRLETTDQRTYVGAAAYLLKDIAFKSKKYAPNVAYDLMQSTPGSNAREKAKNTYVRLASNIGFSAKDWSGGRDTMLMTWTDDLQDADNPNWARDINPYQTRLFASTKELDSVIEGRTPEALKLRDTFRTKFGLNEERFNEVIQDQRRLLQLYEYTGK